MATSTAAGGEAGRAPRRDGRQRREDRKSVKEPYADGGDGGIMDDAEVQQAKDIVLEQIDPKGAAEAASASASMAEFRLDGEITSFTGSSESSNSKSILNEAEAEAEAEAMEEPVGAPMGGDEEREQQGGESWKFLVRKVFVPPVRIKLVDNKSLQALFLPLIKELKIACQWRKEKLQILLVPAFCVDRARIAHEIRTQAKLNAKAGDASKSGEPSSTAIAMPPPPTTAEIRTAEALMTKAVEYVRGYLLGFSLVDCLALLRLDDIFLQSFVLSDVRRLVNDNVSRAIGRIAGKDGKTRNAIQNATRTRLIIQDKTIHLLGGHRNISLARDAICALIIGKPPSKVYKHLSVVSRRMKESR